ncbi:hypothetical protein D3C80_1899790 [compost metagenome]
MFFSGSVTGVVTGLCLTGKTDSSGLLTADTTGAGFCDVAAADTGFAATGVCRTVAGELAVVAVAPTLPFSSTSSPVGNTMPAADAARSFS